MSANVAKRKKVCEDDDTFGHSDSRHETETGRGNVEIKNHSKVAVNNASVAHTDVEYSVLCNQVILDNIMRHLTYNELHKLSLCCRMLRELTAFEFDRRKNGWTTNFLVFQSKNATTEQNLQHPSGEASAAIHMSMEKIEEKLSESIDRLHFRPKIALLFTGVPKVKDFELWTKWYKCRLPSDCTLLNVQSKASICGSIGEHVFEVNSFTRNSSNCGLASLLLGAQRSSCSVQIFKSLKDLVSLTDDEESSVKCILYLSRSSSRAKLPKILSVCKERNDGRSIAFGGLIVDSLASFTTDTYTSKIECAGLVFSGSEVAAASTIIEDLANDPIRDALVRFRDSIPFDISDETKDTICFLLSCIEHTPRLHHSPEYTSSEMDIFHTIFPRNVKVCGISGHGEFGQVSGVIDSEKKISFQYSCIVVVVQSPRK